MGAVRLRSAVPPESMPLSHRSINGTLSCLKKCFVHDMVPNSHAFHVPRWHRKMKNLTSLDYSSDLHDDTNYSLITRLLSGDCELYEELRSIPEICLILSLAQGSVPGPSY